METDVKVNVIKRNGEEVSFDLLKIANAIKAANQEVAPIYQLNEYQIQAIADNVAAKISEMTHAVHVEDIQDMVETAIMEMRGYEVAQKYVRYRYKRELSRKSNTTDNGILSLIEHLNEEVNQENSNKNPVINSTQRDYMAGEVSKDLTMRVLLPEEVVRAHEKGIIHFHDSDYFAQKEHNCDLINLEDMLQNGTVISETLIEKPHSFSTACNITTQIVAQVASNQYGGQSFTLSHLAPFVDVSREKIRKAVIEEREALGEDMDLDIISKIVERRLRKEVQSGIQTIQYQLITLMTCNGQAPFVTMFMYLDEVPEGKTRDDLAMLIEEALLQRMQGVMPESLSAERRWEILRSVWKHDIDYTSKVVGGKVMLIQLNNGEGKFYASQKAMLEADIALARANGYAVLAFMHEPISTGNASDTNITAIRKDDGSASGNYYSGQVGGPNADAATKAICDIIAANGDIIKGVFNGHQHADYYSEILAKTASGADTIIPQYTLSGCIYGNGNALKITVK